jgi:hypothetical protein
LGKHKQETLRFPPASSHPHICEYRAHLNEKGRKGYRRRKMVNILKIVILHRTVRVLVHVWHLVRIQWTSLTIGSQFLTGISKALKIQRVSIIHLAKSDLTWIHLEAKPSRSYHYSVNYRNLKCVMTGASSNATRTLWVYCISTCFPESGTFLCEIWVLCLISAIT